jgi:hypothetical protein
MKEEIQRHPVQPPLPCFGLEHNPRAEICQQCPHQEPCRVYMGPRLSRITLDKVVFALVPEGLDYRSAEHDADARDIEAIYAERYRHVFGTDPVGRVGQHQEKVLALARQARSSVPMFMLVVMFAHLQAWPDQTFTPGLLVDNRALARVRMYGEAARAQYACFDIYALSRLARDRSYEYYDLRRRMLESEVLAGNWIVRFKLTEAGPPFEPMFQALEESLDPNWLAIEPHYEEALRNVSASPPSARHAVVQVLARLKKHKHQAISNFRAREDMMPQAVKTVLHEFGRETGDLEIGNQPVTDPLRFWGRIGLALQHLECLRLAQDEACSLNEAAREGVPRR